MTKDMNREEIENAAKEAVQNHFQCNGKYPCEERDYCEFCNGHNSAFDCKEDCGADDFNEGFIAGAQWRINAVWHDTGEIPKEGEHIVIVMENRCFTSWFVTPDIAMMFKKFRAVLWTYSRDLLPEGKDLNT